MEQLNHLMEEMSHEGFSRADYDVMENSCNSFTEALATKLGLTENFPTAVHNQTKLGAMFAPVVRLEIWRHCAIKIFYDSFQSP